MRTYELAILLVLSIEFALCFLEKIAPMIQFEQFVNLDVDVLHLHFLVAYRSNNL